MIPTAAKHKERKSRNSWCVESAVRDACPRMSGRNRCQNDGIIAALLVAMRRLGGAFLLQVFHSFDLPTLHWQSYYFLRTHFAIISASCQVTFEIKLYQRMLK